MGNEDKAAIEELETTVDFAALVISDELQREIRAVIAIAKRAVEVWPKWYVPTEDVHSMCAKKRIAFVRLDDGKKGETFHVDGSCYSYSDFTNDERFVEVTEAEALARITPAKPDDPFPHYYETLEPSRYAYLRQDSENIGYTVFLDGTDFGEGTWYLHDSENRKRLTEAEAMARVTPLKPVESPYDWVELPPDHVLRKWIDEYCSHGNWCAIRGFAGRTVDSLGHKARCRRKDLPKPIETPKKTRVPVRLWCMAIRFGEAGGSVVVANPDTPPDGDMRYQEIKSDGNGGWEVEVTE